MEYFRFFTRKYIDSIRVHFPATAMLDYLAGAWKGAKELGVRKIP